MKRIFASTLALTLIAGSAAMAMGPEHKDHAQPAMDHHAEAAPAPTLKELLPPVKSPDLWIGDNAPQLQIAKFVKGESVDQFEKGQVYVVEFWATWCGPCVAAFPHLSEMQADYGDKVKFIGVNVWEQTTGAERIDMITDFVSDQGERMQYTVAVEVDGKMSETWLRPANQNGIPAAFIVDQKGKIAWIGHPMSMEEPLEQVVAGEFDAEKAAAEGQEGELITAGFMKFQELVESGKDYPLMHDIANALIENHITEEPQGLNAIAWMIMTTETKGMPESEYQLAHRA
ncbi:MAG: TlpA family protein disulfide reductase, partial [Phycisphaerales bacterium]|nr:TlpA family protein disulfide reductase [Phycisphaerales bacterium]